MTTEYEIQSWQVCGNGVFWRQWVKAGTAQEARFEMRAKQDVFPQRKFRIVRVTREVIAANQKEE